jgi:hypothetical protein
VLCERSHLAEIRWNFCRFKEKKERLRLSQNPQFYAPLPTSTKRFRVEPTENFLVEKVHVLTDNPSRRVYLETARGRRAFGNVWMFNDTLIFKGSCLFCSFVFSMHDIFSDICGMLEGESIVGEAFRDTPNLWCFQGHDSHPQLETLTSTHPRTHSRKQNRPSHITTGTLPSFTTGVPIQDWKEPIRRMVQTLDKGLTVDFSIRISDRPSINRSRLLSSLIPTFLASSASSDDLPQASGFRAARAQNY